MLLCSCVLLWIALSFPEPHPTPQNQESGLKITRLPKEKKISLILVFCDFAVWALRMLWGPLSRLFSAVIMDGFVYCNPSQDPPADPHKWGWGGAPAATRLEIKAHVLAILGGFWDQMVFDLSLQKLSAPMRGACWEVMEELGDEMRGSSSGSSQAPHGAAFGVTQLEPAKTWHSSASQAASILQPDQACMLVIRMFAVTSVGATMHIHQICKLTH